ncbi:substrate-binding domain-containing protein, partial [Butyribacter intestini]
CHPSLSTIRQDTKGLAQKASSLLLNLMNDKEVQLEERRFILPVEVIQRDSTHIK